MRERQLLPLQESIRDSKQRIEGCKAVLQSRKELLDALVTEWDSDPVVLRLRQEEREDFEACLTGGVAPKDAL
jgi:hypothetical protein